MRLSMIAREPKHISFGALGVVNYEPRPQQFKMAAYRPDVTIGSQNTNEKSANFQQKPVNDK